ncbi:MAG: hypothetical protein HY823_04205 [Acidobacteria bacterium]|nr:hypothetical protein [Acidobacteriota bacterium]
MHRILLSALVLGSPLIAREPGPLRQPAVHSSPISVAAAPVAGARVSRADAERMIQNRENRLTPSAQQRNFVKDPAGVHGWAFSRRALLEMLGAMKDQSDDALVYVVLGDAENTDAAGIPIPGTWHETLILCEVRPFTMPMGIFLAEGDPYFLQHPVLWP